MFEYLMHSWVGYELVKVLLKYGLSLKLRSDLNKWSPELFELFSYFGKKQWDPSKSPTRLLNILFKNTEHSSYFGKLLFGKRTKFEKMANTTIPLVILTWLCQLQEHFFEQPENSPHIDWNDSGRYCNVPIKNAVVKGVNHVHICQKRTLKLQQKLNLLTASNQTRKILKKSSNLFSNGRRGFCIGKVSMCRT